MELPVGLLKLSSIFFFLGLFLLCACGQTLPEPVRMVYDKLPEQVDFNFHVKPILSDRCYTCHGPDNNTRKADFRLDTEAGAFSALADGGHAFVGGSINKSVALKRIFSEDPEEVMPPPESNLSLSNYERALIAKWVNQGAVWKDHWSFIPPEKPDMAQKETKGQTTYNGIDTLILAKLTNKGLSQSAPASKETWLRRVHLDLVGLPPSLKALQAFTNDTSPAAYEKVVDALLSSEHYGERMAMEWLDLARYADTHGYQDDGMRNTWPWRDWVIKAFNENMPYDQFLIWQLAGDLLPNPTKDQLIATCFNRNHPQTQEGGVVEEEYRVEYVADRTNTFGKAFLGLTTECARCHDHKYDPLSQKEYYALSAYFNNNRDHGIVPYNGEASPALILPSREAEIQLASIHNQMDSLALRLEESQYLEKLHSWLEKFPNAETDPNAGIAASFHFEQEHTIDDRRLPLQKRQTNKPEKYRLNYAYMNQAKGRLEAKVWGDIDSRPALVAGRTGQGLQFQGDAGIRFHKRLDYDRHQPFSVSIWVKLEKAGEAGPIFNKSNGDFEGFRGWLCKLNDDGTLSFQLNHVWPDNSIDLRTRDTLVPGKWHHVVMTYDGSSSATGLNVYLDGRSPEYQVVNDNLYKSILHGTKGSNWNYTPLLLGIENQRSIQDMVMDEFRVYDRQLSALEVSTLFEGTAIILKKAYQQEQLRYYLLSGRNSAYNQALQQLTALRQQENILWTDQPEIMIMKEDPQVRQTFVLDRGAYDAPLEQVYPNTPSVFGEMPDSLAPNRLGLAQWLTQDHHPLTSRVMANRLWSMCFGRGLVATQEDFGNQGNLPTHPELLDWLAVDLVEQHWDIKAFLKKLVLSATYRQSSVATTEALTQDPENLWYSYYPAHRLPAELIRDQALASSGLLVPQIGGPSVYPYQPTGIWKALATRNATEYRQQHGDSLYRRSMYTVWKRSSPPPAMTNFDAPDRYYCVVRRQNTSTPLQSLVMMNDPQFMEAARMLGERMLKEGGASIEQRIDFAFKALIGRRARSSELTKLRELYHLELKDFSQEPGRREHWLSSGEHPRDYSLDQDQLAASTTIASTLMNFDEFTMKR